MTFFNETINVLSSPQFVPDARSCAFGINEGSFVGIGVGTTAGIGKEHAVGISDGFPIGSSGGIGEGSPVGSNVGMLVFIGVGCGGRYSVGVAVGIGVVGRGVGMVVSICVGMVVGIAVGIGSAFRASAVDHVLRAFSGHDRHRRWVLLSIFAVTSALILSRFLCRKQTK